MTSRMRDVRASVPGGQARPQPKARATLTGQFLLSVHHGTLHG